MPSQLGISLSFSLSVILLNCSAQIKGLSTNWQNSEVREVVVMNKEDVVQVKEELADLGVKLDKTKKDAFCE